MHDLAAWQLAVLALVGAAAGFVNTVAGAGSLLSLRALMLFGMPAGIANGTNRVPVLAQSLAAAQGFFADGKLPTSAIVAASWPACVGALVGSVAASYVPEREMKLVLIGVLFLVAVLGLRKVKRAPDAGEHGADATLRVDDEGVVALCKRPAIMAWLFAAGAYGGFLQAGVGLILLHALSTVGGLDLVRANALKAVVVAIFSVVAVGVFLTRGMIVWVPALAMTAGAVVGAKLAVRFAISWADRLKVVVVVVDLVACVALLATM
jgi:uncharacterized membrane protein YfcA